MNLLSRISIIGFFFFFVVVFFKFNRNENLSSTWIKSAYGCGFRQILTDGSYQP